MLATVLQVPDSEFDSSEAVLAALQAQCGDITMNNLPEFAAAEATLEAASASLDDLQISLYQTDAIVRRATALQATARAQREQGFTTVLQEVQSG